MLKMAFCAFKIFRDNIWKMTPCLPPPPKIWNFPYVSSLFFLKASLTERIEIEYFTTDLVLYLIEVEEIVLD